MDMYSEALNCWAKNPWSCGLNVEDRMSYHHAKPESLRGDFSVYGVGGSYRWEGPTFVDVW